MDLDVGTLPNSLIERLASVIREAKRAGCSLVRVTHSPAKGFESRIEWHGGHWELEAGAFDYLLGHMEQVVKGLTP